MKITNKRINQLIRESIQKHVNETVDLKPAKIYLPSEEEIYKEIEAQNPKFFVPIGVINQSEVYSEATPPSNKVQHAYLGSHITKSKPLTNWMLPRMESKKGKAAGLNLSTKSDGLLINPKGEFYIRVSEPMMKNGRMEFVDKSTPSAAVLIDPNAVYWKEELTVPHASAYDNKSRKKIKQTAYFARVSIKGAGTRQGFSTVTGSGSGAQSLTLAFVLDKLVDSGFAFTADDVNTYLVPISTGAKSGFEDVEIRFNKDITNGTYTIPADYTIQIECKRNNLGSVSKDEYFDFVAVVSDDLSTIYIDGYGKDVASAPDKGKDASKAAQVQQVLSGIGLTPGSKFTGKRYKLKSEDIPDSGYIKHRIKSNLVLGDVFARAAKSLLKRMNASFRATPDFSKEALAKKLKHAGKQIFDGKQMIVPSTAQDIMDFITICQSCNVGSYASWPYFTMEYQGLPIMAPTVKPKTQTVNKIKKLVSLDRKTERDYIDEIILDTWESSAISGYQNWLIYSTKEYKCVKNSAGKLEAVPVVRRPQASKPGVGLEDEDPRILQKALEYFCNAVDINDEVKVSADDGKDPFVDGEEIIASHTKDADLSSVDLTDTLGEEEPSEAPVITYEPGQKITIPKSKFDPNAASNETVEVEVVRVASNGSLVVIDGAGSKKVIDPSLVMEAISIPITRKLLRKLLRSVL